MGLRPLLRGREGDAGEAVSEVGHQGSSQVSHGVLPQVQQHHQNEPQAVPHVYYEGDREADLGAQELQEATSAEQDSAKRELCLEDRSLT